MDPNDILHLEAQGFIRQASDEMLELATPREIDLATLAHHELRAADGTPAAPIFATCRASSAMREKRSKIALDSGPRLTNGPNLVMRPARRADTRNDLNVAPSEFWVAV
jgi:hypothetical protein